MKKGIKGILLLVVLVLFILTWTVFIPLAMKSRTPSVTRYLEHEGYTNVSLLKVNQWTYSMFFEGTKDGMTDTVQVRFSKNGVYNIIY